MADGVCVWRIRDSRCKHETGDIVAKDHAPAAYEYLIACNGQTFDTAKYPQLAAIYTSGRLPNLNDSRFLEGSTAAGTSKDAGLPQHTHSGTADEAGEHTHDIYAANNASNDSGKIKADGNRLDLENDDRKGCAYKYTSGSSGSHTHTFTTGNASDGLYGKSDTVQPKSYTVTWYVCYA